MTHAWFEFFNDGLCDWSVNAFLVVHTRCTAFADQVQTVLLAGQSKSTFWTMSITKCYNALAQWGWQEFLDLNMSQNWPNHAILHFTNYECSTKYGKRSMEISKTTGLYGVHCLT